VKVYSIKSNCDLQVSSRK